VPAGAPRRALHGPQRVGEGEADRVPKTACSSGGVGRSTDRPEASISKVFTKHRARPPPTQSKSVRGGRWPTADRGSPSKTKSPMAISPRPSLSRQPARAPAMGTDGRAVHAPAVRCTVTVTGSRLEVRSHGVSNRGGGRARPNHTRRPCRPRRTRSGCAGASPGDRSSAHGGFDANGWRMRRPPCARSRSQGRPAPTCSFNEVGACCVSSATSEISEWWQLERLKSTRRYLPPKGTAGGARCSVSTPSPSPLPPARKTAVVPRIRSLLADPPATPAMRRCRLEAIRAGDAVRHVQVAVAAESRCRAESLNTAACPPRSCRDGSRRRT
jgi:hypothetical protein